MQDTDVRMLRSAFEVAVRAREHGNHAFGAIIVSPRGEPLLAAENSVVTERDVTGHAELNLVRAVTKVQAPEVLQTCTMYSSAEPCPMCAASIVWANIRRVVYGLSMEGIYQMFADAPADSPSLRMHSRVVLDAAPWPVEVVGPELEDEARDVFG